MNLNSAKTLLLALLFALHLVLQPLAAASMCGWGSERMACCMVDAPPAAAERPAAPAQSSCCGSVERPAASHSAMADGSRSQGPQVDKSGCDCQAAPVPPLSIPPDLTEFHKSESVLVALPVASIVEGQAALIGERHFKVPKDPPRAKARAVHLLNRVFLL